MADFCDALSFGHEVSRAVGVALGVTDVAAGGQIQGIRSIINPDKLRHLGPVSDLVPSLFPRRSSA